MSKGMDVPANGYTYHESSHRIVLFNGPLRVVLFTLSNASPARLALGCSSGDAYARRVEASFMGKTQ